MDTSSFLMCTHPVHLICVVTYVIPSSLHIKVNCQKTHLNQHLINIRGVNSTTSGTMHLCTLDSAATIQVTSLPSAHAHQQLVLVHLYGVCVWAYPRCGSAAYRITTIVCKTKCLDFTYSRVFFFFTRDRLTDEQNRLLNLTLHMHTRSNKHTY